MARFCLGFLLVVMVGAVPVHAAWYSGQWSHRIPVTLNHALVQAPLTDFPVLVYCASSADLAAVAKADGSDLVVTAADGVTKLSREIDHFVSGTGELWLWVRVPVLPADADTVLYLYYGNPSGSETDDASTWDANYRMVQHLQDATASTTKDSTGNGNNGTKHGTSETSGAVWKGQDIGAGLDHEVEVPDAASLRLPTNMTLEAWLQTSNTDGDYDLVMAKWRGDLGYNYWLGKFGGSNFSFYVNGGNNSVTIPLTMINNGVWHHVAAVADAALPNLQIYVDGVSKATNTYSGSSQTGTCFLWIGNDPDSSNHTWHGPLDECRISSVARSASWIKTEYNNQSHPANFALLGSPESGVPDTPTPTNSPTTSPSDTPTTTPTATPTGTPTTTSTDTPTDTPTSTPTASPTNTPTDSPTSTPTVSPTGTSTDTPTLSPSMTPSTTPTAGSIPTATSTRNELGLRGEEWVQLP